MDRWGIKEIIWEDTNCGDLPHMEFTIDYYGTRLVDAAYEMHRAVSHFNGEMFAAYPISIDFDIRSRSLSLFPDKRDIRKQIKKVIFNDPATIIIWKDGNKTVVKTGEGEIYDPEKGFAMAVAKYAFGNQGNYYETFKKWLPKEEEKEEATIRSFNDIINDVKDDLNSMFSKFMNPPEEENNEHD